MKNTRYRWALLALLVVAACGSAGAPGAAAGADAGDGGPTPDAGAQAIDGGSSDAGADGGTADAGDTWANYAQSFFATYCTSCHSTGGAGDPTGSGLDFTQYAQVQGNGPTIRCGVAGTQDPTWGCGSFPPAAQFPICNTGCTNPKPADPERARLVAWISAGMPE